jgi:hypothetical protein
MLTDMKIEWQRGCFRAWAVLALVWVALVGWNQFGQWSHGLSYVYSNGECWDRLAKWPDGTPFDVYDAFYNDTKDSSSERDRWRDTVRMKLGDCEAAKPILRRLKLTASDYWPALRDSLSLILLPPLALLIAGWLLAWTVRGFRTST